MNMPDHPEQPDDVEVLLRNYAASRQTFAANAPDLHEADIRRLAAEACKERHQGAPVAASLWDRWRGFFGSLTTPQWSAAAVTASAALGAMNGAPAAPLAALASWLGPRL